MITRRAWLAAATAALAMPSRRAAAAPKAVLWERWQAQDPTSASTVDHRDWASFLTRYRRSDAPDGIARVAYAAVTSDDRALLDAYMARLSAVAVSRLNRDTQFGFWANLYNALTVRVVLEHFPVASIRDIGISPGLFARGPWGATLITVEGEGLTLDDIEHRILRPIWRDPRVHYAVNCAALGCPDLAAVPIDLAVLDGLATAFVNHPRGVRVSDGRLVASSIYDWFAADFGDGDEAGVIAHLRRFAAPDLRRALESATQISGYAYDWQLNGG